MNKRRAETPKREIRVYAAPQKFEVRKNEDGTRSVAGYFATFNTLSHDLGFREKLLPGAFAQSLRDNPVQCLFNHDNSKLLGRTESGTLRVREDSRGLRFDVNLPDTSYANDLVALMERGDAYECSFAFNVPNGGEQWSELQDGTLLRTISQATLYEGSILVSPAAYPKTSANLRSLPANLRGKLKDIADCEDDPDGPGCKDRKAKREGFDCDDDMPDDVDPDEWEEVCGDDRKRKNRDNGESVDDCDCDCSECEAGNCEQCSDTRCTRDECSNCPAQMRAAHRDLLLRRMRA